MCFAGDGSIFDLLGEVLFGDSLFEFKELLHLGLESIVYSVLFDEVVFETDKE